MARSAQPLASCLSASSFRLPILSFAALGILLASCLQSCSAATYGKPLGKLSQLHHGVSGEVFAVDGRTLYIKDLTYDGEGPAAYFYAGNSKTPIVNGFRVPDERGTYGLLRRYRKEDITLTLPEGKTLNNIRWFAIWCDDFSVNFGDVRIPRGFDYPRPQKLGSLNGIHGVSSEPVVVVDAQTLLIPGFSYDGEAPDAKFWAGPGSTPTPQGIRIPDENGKETPLRKYDHKTIVLTLPGDLTVHELGHFGVWCEAFTVDFGHVKIPQSMNVPPSLKMLGVSPQSKLNCEVLQDDLAFEVRWAVAGDSVVVQLVAKLDGGQYMSFGLSPDSKKSIMVGGDVVVAWVDKETLQGYAFDYFLDAKSQCSGQRGSCPDTRIQDNSNSVRLLNAAMVNGYSIVTYQRPLKASDELDVPITTNGSQAIIWAIGPLNERKEVSFHSDYLRKDQLIEFGRPPRWNCPMPDNQDQDRHPALMDKDKDSTNLQTEVTTRRPQRVPPPPAAAPKNEPWEIPPIHCSEPADGVFYAQMGPTGGKHGYPAITGHVGWGISWYINGLLIPEINVVRGKKYTFVVEGGSDPEVPARYHPFYITDDPIGGYQHKTPEEKENVRIFAGVKHIRGTMKLTGVGRLCNWVPDQSQPLADEFSSFGAYQRTLTLECDHGEPGIVEWTPDADTPDTVYYQCFTHRHLGWKINVHDECDADDVQGSASEMREVYVELPGRETDRLVGGESIRVSSKVTPGPEFFQEHREYIRNPSSIIANNLPNVVKDDAQLPFTSTQLIRLKSRNPTFQIPYESLMQSFEDHHRNHHHNHQFSHDHHQSHQLKQVSPSASGLHYNMNNNGNKHTLGANNNNNNNKNLKAEHGYQGAMKQVAMMNGGYEVREVRERQRDPNLKQKLIADIAKRNRGPVMTNFGLMKLAYNQGAPTFSRPSASVYPEPQLLVVQRRPVQSRRPSQSLIPNPVSLLQQRASQQFVMQDRKKPIYRQPQPSSSSSPHHSFPASASATNEPRFNAQITKLTKTDFNQNTIESKMSQGEGAAPRAKNTGFKPESVVVEGGFKPILRVTEITDYAEDRHLDIDESDDAIIDSREYAPLDNFEPMFVPSPPDGNQSKKLKKKAQRNKRREAEVEEEEDTQTAADSPEAYYLPPTAPRQSARRPQIQAPVDGALVTADGTQVLDANLARSIPKVNERPGRGRLSSDVLSKTPQYGNFRGELPPPIPGNFRPDAIPQLQNSDRAGRKNPGNGNTRLTLVQRSKRAPHHVPGHDGDDDDDTQNMNSSIVTNAEVTPTNQQYHDHSQLDDQHDHHNHYHNHTDSMDHADHGHEHHHAGETSPSAGELVMANIEYIVLTAVLYFVI